MTIVAIFAGILIALQAADMALTLAGLRLGKRESNPLGRGVMRRLGPLVGALAVKLPLAALVIWIVLEARGWNDDQRTVLAVSLAAACVFYGWVVQRNWRIVRKGRP